MNDFEKEARAYFGVKHALATATGSGSFYCAMAGLGLGPGDEVIIPSFGWLTDFEAPVLLDAEVRYFPALARLRRFVRKKRFLFS